MEGREARLLLVVTRMSDSSGAGIADHRHVVMALSERSFIYLQVRVQSDIIATRQDAPIGALHDSVENIPTRAELEADCIHRRLIKPVDHQPLGQRGEP